TRTLGLNHTHDHARLEQDLRRRVVHVLALADRQHPAVAVQCLLDRFHRARTPRTDRDRHTGKHYRVPEREHRKLQSLCHQLLTSFAREMAVRPTAAHPRSSKWATRLYTPLTGTGYVTCVISWAI